MKWLTNYFRRRSEYKRNQSFLWTLLNAYMNHRNMRGYLRENMECDDMIFLPSTELKKRYNIDFSNDNIQAWAILEMYFNGELVKNNG